MDVYMYNNVILMLCIIMYMYYKWICIYIYMCNTNGGCINFENIPPIELFTML